MQGDDNDPYFDGTTDNAEDLNESDQDDDDDFEINLDSDEEEEVDIVTIAPF